MRQLSCAIIVSVAAIIVASTLAIWHRYDYRQEQAFFERHWGAFREVELWTADYDGPTRRMCIPIALTDELRRHFETDHVQICWGGDNALAAVIEVSAGYGNYVYVPGVDPRDRQIFLGQRVATCVHRLGGDWYLCRLSRYTSMRGMQTAVGGVAVLSGAQGQFARTAVGPF